MAEHFIDSLITTKLLELEQSNLLDIIDYISNSNATERLEAQRMKVREGNRHIEEKTLYQFSM